MAMKAADVYACADMLPTHAYLDVRTPAEFAAGHVIGAKNVPVMVSVASGALVDVPPAAFAQAVKEAMPDTRCGARSE